MGRIGIVTSTNDIQETILLIINRGSDGGLERGHSEETSNKNGRELHSEDSK